MELEYKLKELINAIRKAIPRLMELNEGDVFMHNGDQVKVISFGKVKSVLYNTDKKEIEVFKTRFVTWYNGDIVDLPKLINPTLIDVLEWLPNGHAITTGPKTGGFLMFDANNRMEFSCIKITDIEGYRHYRWDLSKPYLKDQSPELINFLHKQIK